MNKHYLDTPHTILEGSLPLKELYGRFPEFLDVMAVIRNIYGDDFVEIFERSYKNYQNVFDDIHEIEMITR
ncbi:MAG: hypothetical protein O7C59_01640 [Rickettsia endosymbiont of Ixodes persulcatus]|nr:hypothetical protein [Rickettsia endosymbiont of Ixodes persulcatus]